MGDANSYSTQPWVETHGNRVVGVPPKHPKRSVGFLGEFHTATTEKKHRSSDCLNVIGNYYKCDVFWGAVTCKVGWFFIAYSYAFCALFVSCLHLPFARRRAFGGGFRLNL
jgi:hypothetical protein